MEEDKIELYSEEVVDLLGTPPRKLVRWGITVFFLVISALITLSTFINYPDKVAAPITITTPYPPSAVITRIEGNLSLVDYVDGNWIEQGGVLGIIENPANEQDVLALEAAIDNIKEYKPKDILDFEPKEKLELGSLQGFYSEFTTLFENYTFASTANYDIRKIRQLREQIQNIEDLNAKILKNQLVINKALDVAKKRLDRKDKMFKDSIIAEDVYDEANEQYLTTLKNNENGAMEIRKNKLLINDIDREIITIKKNIRLDESSSFVQLTESIKQLQTAIKTWKESYLITASISGYLSFNPDIKSQMYVPKATEVAMVLPKEDNIIGKILLDMKGSGKVKPKNSVIIKFDGYPYQEYGIVRGAIKNKSAIPRENKFYVEVELPEGLQTSRGDTLEFQQQIEGRAEIITNSKSLLRRIFDQILTALETVRE